MITDSQTNTVFFSDLLPKKCPVLNQSIAEVLRKHRIPFDYLLSTKDIWCRDYMPIQIAKNRFVLYEYTPDYLQDARYHRLQTSTTEVLQASGIQHLLQNSTKTGLVIDGGNIVKCGDTVVMTEKVFAENKDKSRIEVEGLLKQAFQCDILFLPWDRKEVFGHSDGVVHCLGDGKILLTNYDQFSPYYYRRFRKALENALKSSL